MLSSQIKKRLQNEKSFMGCYPKDKLPSKFPKILPKSIIINTGQSSTSGEHWVALLLLRTSCLYFDSFGLGILDADILHFIGKNYKNYSFNHMCIQHYESKKCGEFCIGFIKVVKNRKDFINFIHKFNFKSLKNNDKQIENILKLV